MMQTARERELELQLENLEKRITPLQCNAFFTKEFLSRASKEQLKDVLEARKKTMAAQIIDKLLEEKFFSIEISDKSPLEFYAGLSITMKLEVFK